MIRLRLAFELLKHVLWNMTTRLTLAWALFWKTDALKEINEENICSGSFL